MSTELTEIRHETDIVPPSTEDTPERSRWHRPVVIRIDMKTATLDSFIENPM